MNNLPKMNNQSKQTEKRAPKDSTKKNDPKSSAGEKAVRKKAEEETYSGEEADFGNVAKKKENSDQTIG